MAPCPTTTTAAANYTVELPCECHTTTGTVYIRNVFLGYIDDDLFAVPCNTRLSRRLKMPTPSLITIVLGILSFVLLVTIILFVVYSYWKLRPVTGVIDQANDAIAQALEIADRPKIFVLGGPDQDASKDSQRAPGASDEQGVSSVQESPPDSEQIPLELMDKLISRQPCQYIHIEHNTGTGNISTGTVGNTGSNINTGSNNQTSDVTVTQTTVSTGGIASFLERGDDILRRIEQTSATTVSNGIANTSFIDNPDARRRPSHDNHQANIQNPIQLDVIREEDEDGLQDQENHDPETVNER